jgi:hypothetical protein
LSLTKITRKPNSRSPSRSIYDFVLAYRRIVDFSQAAMQTKPQERTKSILKTARLLRLCQY